MAASDAKNKDSNDKELARLAREEILADTERARARSETLGAVGWRPCPLPKTNKRFIHNMVIGAMKANRRTTHKGTSSKEETHKQGKSSHSKSFNDKECLKSTNSKSNTRRKRHAREDLPSSKCDELKISSRKKYKK